jgi:hypothetical protein
LVQWTDGDDELSFVVATISHNPMVEATTVEASSMRRRHSEEAAGNDSPQKWMLAWVYWTICPDWTCASKNVRGDGRAQGLRHY